MTLVYRVVPARGRVLGLRCEAAQGSLQPAVFDRVALQDRKLWSRGRVPLM